MVRRDDAGSDRRGELAQSRRPATVDANAVPDRFPAGPWASSRSWIRVTDVPVAVGVNVTVTRLPGASGAGTAQSGPISQEKANSRGALDWSNQLSLLLFKIIASRARPVSRASAWPSSVAVCRRTHRTWFRVLA